MNGFLSQKVKNKSFVVETVVESRQHYGMSLLQFLIFVRVLSFDMSLTH